MFVLRNAGMNFMFKPSTHFQTLKSLIQTLANRVFSTLEKMMKDFVLFSNKYECGIQKESEGHVISIHIWFKVFKKQFTLTFGSFSTS